MTYTMANTASIQKEKGTSVLYLRMIYIYGGKGNTNIPLVSWWVVSPDLGKLSSQLNVDLCAFATRNKTTPWK